MAVGHGRAIGVLAAGRRGRGSGNGRWAGPLSLAVKEPRIASHPPARVRRRRIVANPEDVCAWVSNGARSRPRILAQPDTPGCLQSLTTTRFLPEFFAT